MVAPEESCSALAEAEQHAVGFLAALKRLPFVIQTADEVRAVSDLAEEWGLEEKALLREAKRAGIAVRIGRQLCVKRSALVALVDTLAEEGKHFRARMVQEINRAKANGAREDAYASLVSSSKKRRGKRAA